MTMNMNDQALQHVMNVQTQMLQHLTRLQMESSNDQLTKQGTFLGSATGAFGTPLPNAIASPVIPPTHAGSMVVNDPTKYGTYAAPYDGNGSRLNQAAFQARGFISGSLAEMRNFDATEHSKESTAQYISQQARGVQEQAVNVLGGALSGAATAGSFFIPGGFLASMVAGGAAAVGVGGFTSALTGETREALNYQNILQNQSYKFLNAFESTNEMGGIGMGLRDRQEVSRFLRDLAPEKYLEESEMTKILEGAAGNNLLKTVSDVDSFKKKFTDIVDTVKAITVTMNQTIEETTKFMGELEARGIATQDMSMIAAQSKVMSSFLGINASQGAQILLQTSDSIVSGTSIDPTKIMQSTGLNTFYAEQVYSQARETDPQLAQFIKNSGGSKTVGSAYEQATRGYIQNQGAEMLLGLYGSGFQLNPETGDFEMNREAMMDLLNGSYSARDMQDKSQQFLRTLNASQIRKLQLNVGTIFSDNANSQMVAQFMDRNAQMLIEEQARSGNQMDRETALVEMGMASDLEMASLYEEMIDANKNTTLGGYYNAYTLKEEMDSNAIANSPGLIKRAKFWWEQNVTNPIGNIGQGASDQIGTWMTDYQKFLTGVDDRSIVGGTLLPEFNQEGLSQVLKNSGVDTLSSTGLGGFDSGMLSTYLSRLERGQLDATELSRLKNNEDLNFFERMNVNFLSDTASGRYDGLNKGWYYVDKAGLGLVDSAINFFTDRDNLYEQIGNSKFTLKNYEKQNEELEKKKKNLNQQVMDLYASGNLNLSEDKLKALEPLIEKGQVAEVKAITSNAQAVELTERFKQFRDEADVLGEDLSNFSELSRYTKALATSGTQLGDLLNASGVYSEAEINSLIGDIRKRGVKINKNLGKGKLSATEMAQFSQDALSEYDSIFDMLPQEDLHKLAEYLQTKNSSLQMESFYEKNSTTIDADKLRDYVLDEFRKQNVSEINKTEKSSDSGTASKEATDAAKDHKEAMYEFLNSYQQESQMLRDAIAGRTITNPNQTSLGTR